MAVKLLTIKQAISRAEHKLDAMGYRKVSAGKGTRYYGKPGTFYKIRLSDHHDRCKNDDVLVDLVIDYDTITDDVDARLIKANKDYDVLKGAKRVA